VAEETDSAGGDLGEGGQHLLCAKDLDDADPLEGRPGVEDACG
jgi:hypothetical protein